MHCDSHFVAERGHFRAHRLYTSRTPHEARHIHLEYEATSLYCAHANQESAIYAYLSHRLHQMRSSLLQRQQVQPQLSHALTAALLAAASSLSLHNVAPQPLNSGTNCVSPQQRKHANTALLTDTSIGEQRCRPHAKCSRCEPSAA